ncbi:MAG TPA: hydantoinase/oxoprolinase family protein [Chloroflexota bacterium]
MARARDRLRRPSAAGARGLSFRIGVDVGGTFTDLALLDPDGRVHAVKVPSAPDDPASAVLRALERAAADLGLSAAELLGRADPFVHGTTIGTNALLTRRGPTVGLLTTAGFRDTLAMRRGHREDVWAFRTPDPPPLVPRELRRPVRERVGPDGSALQGLDEADVRAAAERFRLAGVGAVAIGFLFGYLNPSHERRAGEIVRELLPDAFVTCSHEVAPAIGEYERIATTVVNAYLGPPVAAYLDDLAERLAATGLRGPLLISRSNGGLADVAICRRRPAGLALSGPAAGMAAARAFADWLGEPNLISADMGGTSFDVGVVVAGQVQTRDGTELAGQYLALPHVDVHTIGTGGGSLARVDAGGLLRVGPEGAGARPGPAAYGLGGQLATVTDANIVLGRLDPGSELPGGLRLDGELAADALERHVGSPLGVGRLEAARGVVSVATAQMADAIRVMTVERGLDPRRFLLLAAGGAAPQHASEIARSLGIARAYVPRAASVFCALGMLAAEPSLDAVDPLAGTLEPLDAEALNRTLEELAARGRAHFLGLGYPSQDLAIEAALAARYAGRHRELALPLPGGRIGHGDGPRLRAEFDRLAAERFGHADRSAPVEFLAVSVRVRARQPRLEPSVDPAAAQPTGAAVPGRHRPVVFGGGAVPTPVYAGEGLANGATIEGPAVVEDAHTTTLLWPGDRLSVDRMGGYVLELG